MGENNCQAISSVEDTALAICMSTSVQGVGSNSHHGVYLLMAIRTSGLMHIAEKVHVCPRMHFMQYYFVLVMVAFDHVVSCFKLFQV